jgi:hypothetical protein
MVGAKHVTIGYNAMGRQTNLDRYESVGTTNLVATRIGVTRQPIGSACSSSAARRPAA